MNEYALDTKEFGTAEDIFSGYMSNPSRDYSSEKTGADVLDICASIETHRKKKYPLWNFFTGVKPLSALLHSEGEYWFAEIDELNVSSEGFSPREAIDDLDEHIRYFIDFYRSVDDAELTDFARALREKYLRIDIVD